jgi:Uma2 family endonuclease
MRALIGDYRDCIEHLPDGSSLVVHQVSWDDYERLLEELAERPRRRVSYDRGRLEIMTPLPEHEKCARFIDAVVQVLSEELDLNVEKLGSATWNSRRRARGVEPDACYYVANADRVIGKRNIDLETDPAPDVVVEIDISNESVNKLPTYAALEVGEIWRYDGEAVYFLQLAGGAYREVSESASFPGLTPDLLARAIAGSATMGQTAALKAFRQYWRSR